MFEIESGASPYEIAEILCVPVGTGLPDSPNKDVFCKKNGPSRTPVPTR